MVTAEQLRAARAILQMDQAELAKISGVSVETIKRLERQTGKLHAKIETIIAIRTAFEARQLEFLGDNDGRGAGVRHVQPDKLHLVREALIGNWAHTIDQWIKMHREDDPKFFYQLGEQGFPAALTKLLAGILPKLVRDAVSDPPKRWWGASVFPVQAWLDVDRHKEPTAVLSGGTDLSPSVPFLTEIMDTPAMIRVMDDASHMTRQILGLIEDGSDLGSARNRAFVRAFVDAIPASERDALTDAQGVLSAEGITRAKNAVLVKAYGHADIVSRITDWTDDDIKSISNGLVMAAPEWAEFRADIAAGRTHPDFDKTSALIQAVKQTVDMRSRGQNLNDYLAQQDTFDKLPKAVEDFMRLFYDTAGSRAASDESIAKGLRLYVEKSTKASNRAESSRK